jgi:hypothetical protein
MSKPQTGVRVVAALYFALVFFGIERNFHYLTAWTAFILFLAALAHPESAYEWGLMQVATIQTWTVAVGITVITIQDPTLMDDASAQYGPVLAWTGNVILHYIPPLLQSWYLHHTRHLLARHMHPRDLLAQATTVLAIAGIFCVVSDPVELYHIKISLLTFLGFLAPIVASVALCLALASAAVVGDRVRCGGGALAVWSSLSGFLCRCTDPVPDSAQAPHRPPTGALQGRAVF